MSRPIFATALAALCSGLAGCQETFQRLDGITPAAGDAIAANTVMQMVDPWQYGVQNTKLLVPAARPQSANESTDSDSSDDAGSQPETTSN